MSKVVRLSDFQVYARPAGLAGGEQRVINEALFSAYEPVRLWLKDYELEAPFRKIVVSLVGDASSAHWHGNVSNAVGVCEVTEAVELPLLSRSAGDHRWVLSIAAHALSCVSHTMTWRSKELESFISSTAEQKLPLVHFFKKLAQVDRSSGVKCIPWLSTQPGETRIGVQLVSPDKAERDVLIQSKPAPLYLEDSFPMAKSAIRGPYFVLLDKAGKTLASVPIGPVLH